MSWVWWVALAAVVGARELDPAACSARFDVQRDKIIRTEESRSLGARYLSEVDVGARRECLRLCCETDACDVFVFEEKSPGSCYLFSCGPPEDFRCKFTAHGNFSSGVLALSRRLAELQDEERFTHERELASLRSTARPTAVTTPRPHTTPAPSRPAPSPPAPSTLSPVPLVPLAPLTQFAPRAPQPSRCSRYQFECRRDGECIAVYNACDGVPQCVDGSDEAVELGCPPAPATAPPPPVTPPQWPAADVAGGALWPRRLVQAQPQLRYSTGSSNGAGSSHIFSHKGGLVQEAAFEPPAPEGWPRRAWPQHPAGVEGVGAEPERGWGYGRLEWDEPRRAWPVPPAPDPEIPVYMPPKAMPELPMVYAGQLTMRDEPKKGFELGSGPLPATPVAPPVRPAPQLPENTTKKKALKDETTPSRGSSAAGQAHAGVPLAHAAHAPLLDDRDGLSEHPPTAVLLLVLGSLMCAALGALLAARARAARRRRARPRPALEPDYLVNGMYL